MESNLQRPRNLVLIPKGTCFALFANLINPSNLPFFIAHPNVAFPFQDKFMVVYEIPIRCFINTVLMYNCL